MACLARSPLHAADPLPVIPRAGQPSAAAVLPGRQSAVHGRPHRGRPTRASVGPEDHIVRWAKPTSTRSLDREAYRALPESITIREVRVRVAQPGFRTKSVVVVTTLLDPRQTAKEDLATLYRVRWNAELDLRSIKSGMQMSDLRGKTPELVRKEVWTHIMAYNLIRTVMAQAAARQDVVPRSISFTGTLQTVAAFQPLLALGTAGGTADRLRLYHDLLDAIAAHPVANRPDRFEPRVKKQRRNHYGWLTRPRAEMKRRMAKRVTQK